jgi:hypothetical protein
MLQQGECLLSGGACRSHARKPAKSGADVHEARSAHHRRRANSQRGQAPQESTPRDNNRTHLSNPRALVMSTRRRLHSANADADEGTRGSLLFLCRSVVNCSSVVGLRGHPKSGELGAAS